MAKAIGRLAALALRAVDHALSDVVAHQALVGFIGINRPAKVARAFDRLLGEFRGVAGKLAVGIQNVHGQGLFGGVLKLTNSL